MNSATETRCLPVAAARRYLERALSARIPKATFYRHVASGLIDSFRLGGRGKILIPPTALANYLEASFRI